MPSISSSASLWESGTSFSLPVLEGDHEADVCVVGLGGSGLVCVNELVRLGARVIGLDAVSVGGGAGGRNGGFMLAGIAAFHHDAISSLGRERARVMYSLTLDEMDRIENETPDLVRRVGSLRLAESVEELNDCEAQREAMRADGFAARSYEGPEGAGLLIPGDGVFQPLMRCHALGRIAAAGGARLFERSAVVSMEGGITRTATGSVRAKTTIVATDGALPRLLPELAGEVRTARLQMLATAPTREIDIPRPVYARWGYDYWRQLPDGSIALGGARDIGGTAEWTSETTVTNVVQDALELRLREKLHVTAPVTHRWAASVSYTGTELPIAREVRAGVWAIGAYSGTGNVVGSLLGRGVARSVITGDRALLAPFQTRQHG